MMKPHIHHSWHVTEAEALQLQTRLANQVVTEDRLPRSIRLIAAVDVAYDASRCEAYGAVLVVDAEHFRPIEQITCQEPINFPYVPGLFSFRELPAIVHAIERLEQVPDLFLCDAHGISHPRRFGLASHLGVLYDLPAIGCAKKRLLGRADAPGARRGERTYLRDGGDIVGAVVRIRDHVKPVYVSVGHRLALDTACQWILQLCTKYRLPEPIRAVNTIVQEMKNKSL